MKTVRKTMARGDRFTRADYRGESLQPTVTRPTLRASRASGSRRRLNASLRGRGARPYEKLFPQPQEWWAFGFSTEKPAPRKSSIQSTVAPLSFAALARSTATRTSPAWST